MNREIEIQTLAHLIDEPKNYFSQSSRISEELFSEPDLRDIFIKYVGRVKEGRTPDAVNLSTDDEGRLSVLKLVSNINYDVDFSGWLELLTSKWKERRLDEILFKIKFAKTDISETISSLQQELSSLSEINIQEPRLISEHIQDVFELINENKSKSGLTGISTGLSILNIFTGGWQPGNLVVIAADTSQGKTSLALQFGRIAGLSNYPVGMYSFEMSTVELTARLMSQESEVSSKKMLIGKLEEEAIIGIRKKLYHLSNAPIYIDDCNYTRSASLINSMTALHLTKGAKLFIVDYLQLLSNPNKSGNKEQEVAGIARDLKNFAKRTNTTVLLLSQLNRVQNKRLGSEPKLSDLRDSGQIEEAADIVMLIYRPEVYGIAKFEESGLSTEGKAQVVIAKGRGIGLAKFILNFNKELTLFSNYNEANTNNGNQLKPGTEF